ncbi:PilZ domain-containing protein [Petrachloros mirabilis]
MVTRKHRRFPITMPSTLVQRDQFRHKGSLKDISEKGCRVESVLSPFTGMQVTLLLHVPGEVNPIKIDNAAVRWCGSQGIGVEFLIIAQPEQVRLVNLIKKIENKNSSA